MSLLPGASQSTTLASIRNPFLHQVVSDPWDRAEADVPQINAKAFDECRRQISQVAETRRPTSLLLHGVAGTGKTHLMARLRDHLQSNASRVVFISVRMDSSPARIWRHFRRHLVDDLLRPWQGGATGLQLILGDRLREYGDRGGFEKLREDLRLNYNLALVLGRYYEGKLRSECAAWLRGEQLRENVLASLGVTDELPEEDSLEDQAHETVIHLCRLAAPDPVVFCCDEMEILQTYPGDQKGLFAYGKLASTLVQELTNVLVISSVQSVFVRTLEEAVHESLFQKMSLNRADLQPLTWAQGRHLLAKRMSAVPELAALRVDHPHEPLWPLPENDLKSEFEPGDACVARKLIHRAKELFDARRGMPVARARTLSEALAARLAEYWEQSAAPGSVNRADDILLQGLPVLLGLTGKTPRQIPIELPKPIDLLAGPSTAPVAVSVCNQENLGALARRLKRVLDTLDEQSLGRLVVLRDARLPIGKNAAKCHERLRILREKGVRLLQPSREVLSALDAIRNLLADAAAGNLVHNETVPPATVREWLAANVPHVLEEFLDELEGGAGTAPFAQELLDYLAEHCVVSLREAAANIKVPDEEIARYALGNPGQVGFLAGPPGVLFRLVSNAAGGESDGP